MSYPQLIYIVMPDCSTNAYTFNSKLVIIHPFKASWWHPQPLEHGRTGARCKCGGLRKSPCKADFARMAQTGTKALSGEFEDIVSHIFESEEKARTIVFTGALIRVKNSKGNVDWEREDVLVAETRVVPADHRCYVISARVKFTQS